MHPGGRGFSPAEPSHTPKDIPAAKQHAACMAQRLWGTPVTSLAAGPCASARPKITLVSLPHALIMTKAVLSYRDTATTTSVQGGVHTEPAWHVGARLSLDPA